MHDVDVVVHVVVVFVVFVVAVVVKYFKRIVQYSGIRQKCDFF